MNSEIIHSVVLIGAIGISFLFPPPFSPNLTYRFLPHFLSYFLSCGRFLGSRIKSHLLESVIFTFVILLTINSTGGINSAFFFLLYFLLFSLALLLEPIISITATVALMVFFMISLPSGQSVKSLVPLFSLAFLTPFALFMGQAYIESRNSKFEIRNLSSKLTQKQEETFLFLSLMLKNHLKSIKNAIDNFMGDHELHEIKKHVRNMESLIEKFEKES